MKRLLHQLHRPLVWAISYFILGIIGGTIWADGLYSSFFVYYLILISSIGIIIYLTKKWIYILFLVVLVIGSLRLLGHPVQSEYAHFNAYTSLGGTVIVKEENTFNQVLVIDDAYVIHEDKRQPLKSKVKLIYNEEMNLALGDAILIEGKLKERPKLYNPSDLDYACYLKSQNIVCEVEVKNVLAAKSNNRILYTLREQINKQIEWLFKGRDDGIVHTLVMGEDAYLDSETENMYQKLGIAHLLAISGLHISIIAGLLWIILGYIGCSYRLRNGLSIVGIWGYSLLVGMGVSVVRASIMITVMLILRSLWEEEDLSSSLALAALIILFLNPFQLYQVGFQLSFTALLGILFYQFLYRFIKNELEWSKSKVGAIKYILPSACITLFIAPVLAYHFYEIPLLSVFLNLFVVPLFGILLPLIFMTIGVSFMMPSISMLLVSSILGLLEIVKWIGNGLMTLPFSSWLIGRPSVFVLILYYTLGVVIILKLRRKAGVKVGYLVIGLLSFLIGIERLGHIGEMEITQLYVGQGDCTIITTPKHQTIMIDSGTERSGKKVESYLKYKGTGVVDLAVISHPHEDHIGGLVYLIEKGYHIKQIVWGPSLEAEPYKRRLQTLCHEKKIPLYELYGGDQIDIGAMRIDILSPYRQSIYGDANEDSLVCLVKYGAFEALFTGDISSKVEEKMVSDLSDIDVLKIAHHGSKYSTSSKFLEKVCAEYGMISSGVHNRYGHPHPLTLERLQEQNIEIKCTANQGALFIRTDGKQYTVQSQIQEE